jgi:signal transduction histidine kinase
MRAVIAILALGPLLALMGGVRGQTTGAAAMEGVVTLVDTNRGLLVIQDREQARAVRLESMPSGLRLGERVVVAGKAAPYFSTFPDYPDHPSGSGVLRAFETPSDWGDHFLARLRGFLHVPTDGNYTFWVAADDEAELLLGSNSDAATAKTIASVSTATRLGEWDRDAEQKSQSVFLKAGGRYYIEARQREWRGHDHLAVAWQGPGFERRVIGGDNLSPWRADGGVTNGILREYWTNSFLTRLAMLPPKVRDEGMVRMDDARVKLLGPGELPSARRVRMDRLSDVRNFSWVEIEGAASFVAADNGVLMLELMESNGRGADTGARMTVRVLDWGNRQTAQLSNRKVHVRGVCERALDAKGEATAAILWAQDAQQLTPLDIAERYWRELEVLPMFDLTPANLNLAWGRKVLVRGTVIRCDAKSGAVTLRGDDSFYASSSSDGTTWNPVGLPVPMAMGDSIFAGLAVSSMKDTPGTEATFDQVSADLSQSQSVGLGNTPTNGSVTFTNASVTIRPGGGNDWDATDEGLFLCQRLDGEGEIVARLESFQTTRISDKAGLMMRESLNADAPYIALAMTHGKRLDLQYRASRRAIAKAVDHVPGATPQWLKLTRRQNTHTAQLVDGEKVRVRQQVELVGLLHWKNGEPVLTDAYVRPATRMPRSVPAVAETREVRIADLPSDVAESEQYLGENYLIRGVVTFMGRAFNRNLLFLQDDSGAALVRVLPGFFRSQRLAPGQLVEVKGEVRFSSGAPPFGLTAGTVLGWGELPQPAPYPERSAAKLADGGWVEAKGIVRSVTNNVMMVMERDGRLPVWVGGLASSNALARYVDSLVAVRGVFSLQVAPGPVLLVPSPQFIEVKESAPADPFIIPSFAINKVCAQEVNAQWLHRTKVAGVVTYRDELALIIQDTTAGARVLGSVPGEVSVGDRVEVVGFPELEGEAVTLREALLRKTRKGHLPAPTAMMLEGVLDGRLNCWLVRLEGIVLDHKIRDGRQLLELQNGQRVFQAVLPASAGRLQSLPAGSRVQVTGVNQLQFAGHTHGGATGRDLPLVATVDVLMRSPADLLLLERPPWWTWKHTAALVAALALVLIGSLMWIHALRRRVEQRTRELRETMGRLKKETEVSATLAERDRLAAEIHDTLEQGLSGIMMQLDGVDSRLNHDAEGARQNLEMARRMVRFSRAEVRHSLWNLESQLLKEGNLGAALTEIARQMSAGNSVSATMEISGATRPLPAAVEHHLVRCSQEALSNALKHSRATAIRLKLNYGDDAVVLSIADDGCGFEPEGVLTGAGTHLGLRNLRSRARKMKGRLDISSQPGKGTTIQLTVPLNGRAEKIGKEGEAT